MVSNEPIQLSELQNSMKQICEGMGIKKEGADTITAIVLSHVNKNAIFNNFSRMSIRTALISIQNTIYLDMIRNRQKYGENANKKVIITIIRHMVYMAMNRGLEGEERAQYYDADKLETITKLAGQRPPG